MVYIPHQQRAFSVDCPILSDSMGRAFTASVQSVGLDVVAEKIHLIMQLFEEPQSIQLFNALLAKVSLLKLNITLFSQEREELVRYEFTGVSYSGISTNFDTAEQHDVNAKYDLNLKYQELTVHPIERKVAVA